MLFREGKYYKLFFDRRVGIYETVPPAARSLLERGEILFLESIALIKACYGVRRGVYAHFRLHDGTLYYMRLSKNHMGSNDFKESSPLEILGDCATD